MSIKKVASKAEYLSRRFRLGLQFNSKCFLSDKNAVPDKRKTYQKISMELKNLTHKCPLFVAKKSLQYSYKVTEKYHLTRLKLCTICMVFQDIHTSKVINLSWIIVVTGGKHVADDDPYILCYLA